MAYSTNETSIDSGNPIELYLFTYNDNTYAYTSSQYYQTITSLEHSSLSGTTMVFNPEYISRGESLILGDSSGSVETCTITVPRTNPIALLYQGAPPEFDKVRVSIYRKHGEGGDDYVRILDGSVSQVTFRDSDAELTVTIENVLNRYVPRGSLSYYCQNCIYDERCTLDRGSYGLYCTLDGGMDGLWLSSTNLLERDSGYFTDGYMQMGDCFRGIKVHVNRRIQLRYPIPLADRTTSFWVYPGCSGLFTVCARRYGNTDNFSGIPYIEPYDAFLHPVDKGAYWVDGNIVYRDTNGKLYAPNLG